MMRRNWTLKTLMVALVALLALSACSTPQMAGNPATGNQSGNDAVANPGKSAAGRAARAAR